MQSFQHIALPNDLQLIQEQKQETTSDALHMAFIDYCSSRLSYNYCSKDLVFMNPHQTRLMIFKFSLCLKYIHH